MFITISKHMLKGPQMDLFLWQKDKVFHQETPDVSITREVVQQPCQGELSPNPESRSSTTTPNGPTMEQGRNLIAAGERVCVSQSHWSNCCYNIMLYIYIYQMWNDSFLHFDPRCCQKNSSSSGMIRLLRFVLPHQ